MPTVRTPASVLMDETDSWEAAVVLREEKVGREEPKGEREESDDER